MPRPREAVADAIRIARAIVAQEGATLVSAARHRDEAAVDSASRDLACRIAQAILDAEREAEERSAPAFDTGTGHRFTSGLRSTV